MEATESHQAGTSNSSLEESSTPPSDVESTENLDGGETRPQTAAEKRAAQFKALKARAVRPNQTPL